jgi:hypothetical protein
MVMLGMASGIHSGRRVVFVALVLIVLGGCAERKYPVVGKVVFKDGTPLPGGMIVFSPLDPSCHVGARGYIRPDGTFELSTEKEGDGSLQGRYQVLVRPPSQGRGEDDPRRNISLIDLRYTRFETSGIEVEVKPGRNELTIEVEKPRPATKG